MDNIFESFSFSDFKSNFLVERDLDHSSPIKLGEISREVSNLNIGLARKLNSWAAKISGKVNKYVQRLQKRPGGAAKVTVRHIPVGDVKTDAAAIIIVNVQGVGEIEASIFDNNKATIRMPDNVADSVNKGKNRKFLSNKDRIADYLIGILEKVA